MTTYKNFIDGKWVKSSSGKTFASLNPANGRPIAKFQASNDHDVNHAIEAAKKAQKAWAAVPAPKRAEVLYKIRDLLKANKKSLAKLEVQEMGKVLQEAEGDVQEAIDVFEYMAAEGRRSFGHTTPSELKDKFAMTIMVPLGVVGLITPWNFPIAIPAWKIAPALIAGNGIVFKPSSDTPLNAVKLIEILTKAGVPKGVVNLVTGSGKEVGMPLVKDDRLQGISFTGSISTGKMIAQNAGVKKVGLELGGKNLIIVMADADLDLAVDGIVWGAFGTSGQRCTACSRVIVHEKIQRELEKKLTERVRKLKVGDGLKKSTDLGPLVNEKAVEKVEKYIEIGKEEGANLLIGGTRLKGNFFNPTIFTDVEPNMRIAQEEIFGPVLSLISFKDLDEAIKIANGVEYGLSSSIYTNDLRNAFKAIKDIEAGIVYVNSSTIGSEVHLPFGGVKNTGNGTREAGIEGIHEFSETKTIYIDYSGKLQKAQGIEWNE